MMPSATASLAARLGAQAGTGVWVSAAFLFPALSIRHDRSERLRLHFLGPDARVFG